jgi:hypothetical protein
MKQPQRTRIEDTYRLQTIMQYHGILEFKQLLAAAYYHASEDVEDIDKEQANAYREEAAKILYETADEFEKDEV